MPELAFISLGSNIEPEKYLPRAIAELRVIGSIIRCSAVYQNPAIGTLPQDDYLNAAVLVETRLRPLEIRRSLRAIEQSLDRVRTQDKFAPRTIDLDLCMYGDLQMERPELTLPDPDILTRPHLALTMAELSPETTYPGTNRKLREIADELIPEADLTYRPDLQPAIRAAQMKEHIDE